MKLSCTGTGDALFTARFPEGYNPSLNEVANLMIILLACIIAINM